jgi:hypothetical protein
MANPAMSVKNSGMINNTELTNQAGSYHIFWNNINRWQADSISNRSH